MKKNAIAMAGLLVLAAVVQADISWGQMGFGPGQSLDAGQAFKEALASEAPAAAAPKIILAGYAAGDERPAGSIVYNGVLQNQPVTLCFPGQITGIQFPSKLNVRWEVLVNDAAIPTQVIQFARQ